MDLSLQNRVALVTGSGRGIGRSHAVLLAQRGADVIVHDIDPASVAETVREVEAAGRRAYGMVVDIRKVADLTAAIKGATEEIGDVSILVNNAGISGRALRIEQIDEQKFDDMFATHVRGSFFATQAVVEKMKVRHYGRIINMSSVFAMGGVDSMSHYAAAKSAISGLTKCWAREFAPFGITVNAIAPGVIETAMTLGTMGKARLDSVAKTIPLGRLATPLEISYAVAWLSSSEADMMTGQIVSPNGGATIVGI